VGGADVSEGAIMDAASVTEGSTTSVGDILEFDVQPNNAPNRNTE
jgi:hypothetical protein